VKGKSNFGYKILFFIALVVAIAHAAARERHPFDYDDPDPEPQTDTPTNAGNKPVDSAHILRFPLKDKLNNPLPDNQPSGMDLQNPANVQQTVDYDPDSQRYYFNEKIGNDYLHAPTSMTLDEYMKYQGAKDEQSYWQRRLDALTLFNKKPELPQMYKEGIFDRIFGGSNVSVKPQGNVDVTLAETGRTSKTRPWCNVHRNTASSTLICK